MEEYIYELKIPKERVAVLIGREGEIKRRIESETSSSIKVDSKEGDVYVSGKDALKLFSAREIINAIGRGFNPEIAIELLKPDYGFEIIAIPDYARNRNDEARLKGRVIGTGGKARNAIEELTETSICVYGKTIGIIGRAYDAGICRRAIVSLLNGSMHSKVYKWLEKQRRIKKTSEAGDFFKEKD